MNKYVLFFFLSFFSFSSYAVSSCKPLQEHYGMSPSQVTVMEMSYEYAGNTGLGATLAAISFYESSAGHFPVGRDGVSAGVHHVLVGHALNLFELPHTEDNKLFVQDALVSNFGLSAHIAMRELTWWKKRHGNDLFKALRSYNQGYFWRIKSAGKRAESWKYAENVTKMAKFIESSCRWNSNLT